MTPIEKSIIQRGADEKKEMSASAAGTGSRFALDGPRVTGTRQNAAKNRERGAEWFFGPEKRDIPTMFSSRSKTPGVCVRIIPSIPLKATIPGRSEPAPRKMSPRALAPLSPRGWRIELVGESGTRLTTLSGIPLPKTNRLLDSPPIRFPRSFLGSFRRFLG